MKAKYTTRNERLTFDIEATDIKGIWDELYSLQEVFEEDTCRKCKKSNLRYVVRKATDGKKEYDYHELRCAECGAKLAFGVLNDGSGRLFPKRKNDDGSYRGEYGWVKWNPETEKEE